MTRTRIAPALPPLLEARRDERDDAAKGQRGEQEIERRRQREPERLGQRTRRQRRIVEIGETQRNPGDRARANQHRGDEQREDDVAGRRPEAPPPVEERAAEEQEDQRPRRRPRAASTLDRQLARAAARSLAGMSITASGWPSGARTVMLSGSSALSKPSLSGTGTTEVPMTKPSGGCTTSSARGSGASATTVPTRRSVAPCSTTGATRVRRSPSGLCARKSASGPVIRTMGSVDGRPAHASGRASGP